MQMSRIEQVHTVWGFVVLYFVGFLLVGVFFLGWRCLYKHTIGINKGNKHLDFK